MMLNYKTGKLENKSIKAKCGLWTVEHRIPQCHQAKCPNQNLEVENKPITLGI